MVTRTCITRSSVMDAALHVHPKQSACKHSACLECPERLCVLQEVRHTYSFFDFQAHVPDSFSFEPCVLLPEGKGCECLYLKCGVDNTDGHRQVMREANPQVPTTANLTFAVDGDLPCATPAGYVTKKHHSSMVAAACMRPSALQIFTNLPALCILHVFLVNLSSTRTLRWQRIWKALKGLIRN
jgi:hypothetical protein